MLRLLLAGALLAVPVAPASAAPGAVGAVVETFVPASVSVGAGETLTLVNLERSPHDVTSLDVGTDGLPLFQSAIVYEPGQTAVVRGVESLEPGLYEFYCSVHEQMRGTVTVA